MTTVDVKGAAERLGLSVAYLNKLRWAGGGPVWISIGRRVTYRIADLDAWQASHARASTAAA